MTVQAVEETSDPTSVENRLESIETKVEQILNFCTTLANMLDAMGNNPMIAAMMPPGVFPPSGE